MKKTLIIIASVLIGYSCIKPHACECTYVYTTPQQKTHILVYAKNSNKEDACKANNKDTSVVCTVKE